MACRSYAGDHGGRYPAALEELSDEIGTDVSLLTRPGGGIEYRYRPGLTDASPDDAILLFSIDPIRFSKHYVVELNLSGTFMDWEEISSRLRAQGE